MHACRSTLEDPTFSLTGFASVKREGLELSVGVTLPVGVELKVGSVQETVMVTGATPVVDVQNVKTESVLTRAVLDTIPIPRNNQSLAQLTVGVYQTSGPANDVGGINGESYAGLATHGGADGMSFQDGMRTTTSTNFVTNSRYQPNQFSVQEMVLDTGGVTAENLSGGVNVNIIPKDGGNRFSGTGAAEYAGSKTQADNLTDDLRSRGLISTSQLRHVSDVGIGLGGPVVKDKVWFFTAHRNWGGLSTAPGVYYNGSPNPLFYTPDLNRPGLNDDYTREDNGRVTWQVTSKQKISGFMGFEDYCLCPLSFPAIAPEFSYGYRFHPNNLIQATWSYPVTSKLLFQAGYTNRNEHHLVQKLDGTGNAVSVIDQVLGQSYGSHWSSSTTQRDAYGDHGQQGQNSMRFSMAYVTGSHSVKAGLQLFLGQDNLGGDNFGNNQPYQFIFRNRVPTAINLAAYPFYVTARVRDTGIYAQDQWTLKRWTFNYGIRYDGLNGHDPAQCRPAGLFDPQICFGEVDNVPNWKDISPRFGAAFDVFGNAKTALRMSIGRYVKPEATDITNRSAPSGAISAGAQRTWNDANGNFFPDCDLTNPNANGECGADDNRLFGTPVPTTSFASDVREGWGVRQYNWQTAISVQQELRPGMGITIGYFNTWWGNGGTDSYPGGGGDWVTDNLAVTPADYTTYCITAPTDPRLPNGGGYQVCGMYDVSPSKFGQVNNLVSNPSNFGNRTYVYNGVDASFNARFGQGGLLYGGLSLGRKTANRCPAPDTPGPGPGLNSTTGTAQFCQYTVPNEALSQFKISGAYPLPWDFRVSATYLNSPGLPIVAGYAAPNSAIAPSLGRNLAACGAAAVCTTSANVQLIAPYTQFEDRLSKFDVRLSKNMKFGAVKVQPRIDVYNVFNASTILSEVGTFGATYRRPLSILAGRFAKFGVQVDF